MQQHSPPAGLLQGSRPADDEDETEKLERGDLARIRDFLWPFARAQRWPLTLLAGLLLIEAAFEMMFPLAQRHIIDDGLVERDLGVITFVLVFLAVSAVVVNTVGLAADFAYSRIAVGIVGDIRAAMHRHLLSLQLADHDGKRRGATMSRFAGDVENIEGMLLEIVPWLIVPTLEVIYSTALMFYFNFWLALVGMLVFPVVLWLPGRLAGRTFKLEYLKRQREATLLSHLQETLSSIAITKAFGLEPHRNRRYTRLNRIWRGISFRSAFTGALVERSASAELYVLHVIVFAAGVWAVYTDRMTLGTLVAFEAIFTSMGEALTYTTQFVPNLASAAGSIRHINELLEHPPSAPDRPAAVDLDVRCSRLVLDDVSFAHAAGRFRLQDVSLVIEPGSRTALVGASGCGKSTLLALLLRFRDPVTGCILVDGHDARDVTRRSYLARIGYVPQEPILFDGSIAGNIALGTDAPSRQAIEAAAAAAEIDSFIRGLPNGYSTRIGPMGSELSVGQRQRLCIARALVRDPAILIVDEPTSALDAETEASLNATLWRLAANRTLICATHKLAGVTPLADQVIVLDRGRVVEVGRHDDLLPRDGAYARLWHSQRSTPAGRSPGASSRGSRRRRR
jgi:ATP-binding cassette, subfamily B, bacterial